MTIDDIQKVYKKLNWTLNESDFNFFIIRTNRVFTNKFTDKFYWFFKKDNQWIIRYANGTSKPGIFYVENPLIDKGVGILKDGQYIQSHKLGLHKGQYEAFIQNTKLTVWRDNDKDDWIDYKEFETGYFGINIHRTGIVHVSIEVDKWSAACMVFSNPIAFNKCLFDFKTNNFKTLNLSLVTL